MHTLNDIREFIVTEFVPGGRPDDIHDDLDLIESGIMDSLGVLNLISAIEYEMGIHVRPEDMNAETFATVGKIHDFIRERLKETA